MVRVLFILICVSLFSWVCWEAFSQGGSSGNNVPVTVNGGIITNITVPATFNIAPANIGSSHPVGNLLSGYVKDVNGTTNLWILGSEANGAGDSLSGQPIEVNGNLTLLGRAVTPNVDPNIPLDLGAIDSQDLLSPQADKRVTLDRYRATDSTGTQGGQRYVITVGPTPTYTFQNVWFSSQLGNSIIGNKGYPYELAPIATTMLEVWGGDLVSDNNLIGNSLQVQNNPFFGTPATISGAYAIDTNHVYISGGPSNSVIAGVYGFNLGMTTTFRANYGVPTANMYTNSANGLWSCAIGGTVGGGNGYLYVDGTNDLLNNLGTGWYNSSTNAFPANPDTWFWQGNANGSPSIGNQSLAGPTSFSFGTNGYGVADALRVGGGRLVVTNSSDVAFALIQTNFVINQLYTNNNLGPQQVWANAVLTAAAVAGSTTLELIVDTQVGPTAVVTNWAAMKTSASTIAEVYTNTIMAFCPPNNFYYFTNTSAGAGNSAAVLGGQLLTY